MNEALGREGLPGDRRRIEHNVDTAFLTICGAETSLH